MKALTVFFSLITFAANAGGPYYTEDGRILSGMSYDKPAKHALPPLIVAMENVDPESPLFAKVLALVQTRRQSMTASDLVRRLKNGEVFSVTAPVNPARCPGCDGWGKVRDAAAKTPDRKSPCIQCKGTGKTPASQKCVIRWKDPKP
jgi:hypothetical protein